MVSIAGDFRKGKSFMLNFFLRYLRWKAMKYELDRSEGSFISIKSDREWLSRENELLEGFGWSDGTVRYTTGIIMWSEPFILPLLGEEVKV